MSTFSLAGHQVNRIGFGAMQLPGPGVMGEPADRATALAVLRRAVELGVNHIDTALFYGPEVSNRLIREALAPYPDDLVLVSKVGAERDAAGGWLPAQRPEQLIADTRANLDTLGLERLPVMNLRHMPDLPPELAVGFDEQLDVMKHLVAEGLIEAFGVSEVTTAQARQAIDAGAVCVQNAYSLLSRDDEPTLRLCAERDVAYVPYFPLGSAFGWAPRVDENERVIAVAARLGATPAQVGLAWLLAHSPNVLLIPGTSSVAHLEDNVAAGELRLGDADLAELEG